MSSTLFSLGQVPKGPLAQSAVIYFLFGEYIVRNSKVGDFIEDGRF
jgi:hypothetical protein